MQTTITNYLENVLKKYFQCDIMFLIDGQEYKSGKFILFNLTTYGNNFYIEFSIQRKKKIDVLKIPYPFSVDEYIEDKLLYFDYRVKTLCKNDKECMEKLHKFANTQEGIQHNKFYNKILEIQFN